MTQQPTTGDADAPSQTAQALVQEFFPDEGVSALVQNLATSLEAPHLRRQSLGSHGSLDSKGNPRAPSWIHGLVDSVRRRGSRQDHSNANVVSSPPSLPVINPGPTLGEFELPSNLGQVEVSDTIVPLHHSPREIGTKEENLTRQASPSVPAQSEQIPHTTEASQQGPSVDELAAAAALNPFGVFAAAPSTIAIPKLNSPAPPELAIEEISDEAPSEEEPQPPNTEAESLSPGTEPTRSQPPKVVLPEAAPEEVPGGDTLREHRKTTNLTPVSPDNTEGSSPASRFSGWLKKPYLGSLEDGHSSAEKSSKVEKPITTSSGEHGKRFSFWCCY